jgi:hypothetical protein
MIAIGPFGEALLTGNGDQHEERIHTGEDDPRKRGPLRHVRGIAGKAYAAGMDRQVYRRDDREVWICIDHDIRPAQNQIVGFESIDGFGENEIYVAGRDGEIWRYDGQRWHRVNSPTDLILHDVCCAGDGNVYAGGQVGMLVAGRDDSWRVIEHGNTRENIWSLAWFQGSLYAATYRGLFRLEGERLVAVKIDDPPPATFYKLSATQDVMWSIGAKDVMAFDGRSWTRID